MNKFDKYRLIPLNPKDPASLARALGQYRQLLDDNLAFRQELVPLFDVEFVAEGPGRQRRLQPSDAGAKRPLLDHALMVVRGSAPAQVGEGEALYISEAIVFAAALGQPSLQEALVETAKAMVAHARRRNDSADLYLDDEHLFGLEALFMLALVYPETAWLLASFYVSHWDTEHEASHRTLLPLLVQANGWTPALQRAYLYCDNPQVRRAFNQVDSVPDLAGHLLAHPEQYPGFCDALMARLQAQPLLSDPSAGSYSDLGPVLGFFHTLRDTWPVQGDPYDQEAWRDQVNQLPFMGQSLEEGAFALYQRLKARSNRPLVVDAQAHDEQNEEAPGQAHFTPALHFFSGLEQGQQLRAYILGQLHGQGAEQLLAKLAPVPVAEAAHSDLFLMDLYHWLEPPFGNDQLVAVFPHYFWDLLEDCPGGHDQALRLLDLFWRLLGRPQFPYALADGLANQLELLSLADFYQRYQQAPAGADQQLEAFCEDFEELGEGDWDLISALDQQSRATQALLAAEQWPQEKGAYVYGAWCAARLDIAEGSAERISAWLDRHLMAHLCEGLADRGLEALVQYLTEANPGGFDPARHGAMLSHLQSLGPLSQQAFAQLCLGWPADLGIKQLFWLQRAHWMMRVPARLALLVQRLWALLVELAPQVLIGAVTKDCCGEDETAPGQEQSLYRMLGKLGLGELELQAFALCHDRQLACERAADPLYWRRYLAGLAQLGQGLAEGGPALLADEAGLALVAALRRRQDGSHLQLLADLQCCYPQRPLPDWLTAEFRQALGSYLARHCQPQQVMNLEQIESQVLAYLDGRLPLAPVQQLLAEALKAKLEAGFDPFLFILLEDAKSERLLTLLLNHDNGSAKHFLHRGRLERCYVHQLLLSGAVAMAERWQHPAIGHARHSDPALGRALLEKSALWALAMLQRLPVPAGLAIALALDYPLTDHLRGRAQKGPLPNLVPFLGNEQRLALVQLLGACPGIRSLADDPSIEVRSRVQRLLEKDPL